MPYNTITYTYESAGNFDGADTDMIFNIKVQCHNLEYCNTRDIWFF